MNGPTISIIPISTHKFIVPQHKCKNKNNPLQAKDQHTQPTSQFQDLLSTILPHIGFQFPEEIIGGGENKHGNRALEDGGEHRRGHVGSVPLRGPTRDGRAARNCSGDGEDMEYDEEESD